MTPKWTSFTNPIEFDFLLFYCNLFLSVPTINKRIMLDPSEKAFETWSRKAQPIVLRKKVITARIQPKITTLILFHSEPNWIWLYTILIIYFEQDLQATFSGFKSVH